MAIFNSYVKLPEGKERKPLMNTWRREHEEIGGWRFKLKFENAKSNGKKCKIKSQHKEGEK